MTEPAYNAIIREELRHWPYTIHQIDDTLDVALIEGRGRQLLFQSLNSQMLTAFVGSGVSAAYGRMSWTEWRNAQVQEVRNVAKAFLALAEASAIYRNALIEHLRAQGGAPAPRDARLAARWLQHRNQVIGQAQWEVDNLNRTFDATSSDRGSFPGGEDLPIMFEIAKKLHDLLLRHRTLFLGADSTDRTGDIDELKSWGSHVAADEGAPIAELAALKLSGMGIVGAVALGIAADNYARIAQRPEAQMAFDELSKTLLVDECPHADHLLRTALAGGWQNGRSTQNDIGSSDAAELLDTLATVETTDLKRDFGGIRRDPERYRILAPFRLTDTRAFMDAGGQWPEMTKPLVERLKTRLAQYVDKDRLAAIDTPRVFLTPSSRFLLPVLWQLHENPFDPLIHVERVLRNDPTAASRDVIDRLSRNLVDEDFKARRSIIADRFDPLVKTTGKLRINRYLTTNYDFEIERIYEDRGYRRFDTHAADPHPDNPRGADSPHSFRTDGLGGVMQDMTFTSSNATDLLSFAAGGTGVDASIFHLHGRATKTDKIIITERDYMDMYLRDDPDREVVDESILMAFAATPILFLGLGMEETDVLRPLRQFMSDQDRQIGYRSILLTSATKDFDSRAKMSAGLYMRYGTHTIFYGGGEVALHDRLHEDGREPDSDTYQSLDWLHRVTQLISALQEAVGLRIAAIDTRFAQRAEAHNETASFADRTSKDALAIEDMDKPLDHDHFASMDLGRPGRVDGLDLEAPLTTLHALVKAVGKLGHDLARNPGVSKDDTALPILLGLQNATFNREFPETKTDFTARIDKLRVHNCRFTNRRQAPSSGPHDHRIVGTDGEEYTGFYVDILTEMMRMCLRPFQAKDLAEALRVLRAAQSALEGLHGAFLTACSNAALDGLEKEWRHWWKDWQEKPAHREARFEKIIGGRRQDRTRTSTHQFAKILKIRGTDDERIALPAAELKRRATLILPARHMRHRVESVITDLAHCRYQTAPLPERAPGPNPDARGRFADPVRTNVRIFDSFIDDLVVLPAAYKRNSGRVVHTLDARRGCGKGVFLSALATRLGLSSYISAAHFTSEIQTGTTPPVFIAANFINLSFAAEIASVFDMLCQSLREAVCTLSCLRAGKLNHAGLSPEDTAGLLNMVISGEDCAVRDDVKLNATRPLPNPLLHKTKDLEERAAAFRGDVAEAEAAHLKDEKAQGLPRLVRLKWLIGEFAREAKAAERHAIAGRTMRPRVMFCLNAVELLFDVERRPKNLEIIELLKFLSSREAAAIPFDLIAVGSLDHMGAFWGRDRDLYRILDESNPDDPKQTERILRRRLDLGIPPGTSPPPDECNIVHTAKLVQPTQFLTDNFPILAAALCANRTHWRTHLANKSGAAERIGNALKNAHENMAKAREDQWFKAAPPFLNSLYHSTRHACHDAIAQSVMEELWQESHQDINALRARLQDEYKIENDDPGSDGRDWVDLRRALAGNRYCLTILMAAAEHIVFNTRDFLHGGRLANDFLRNTVSHLLNASVSQKEEVVMRSVMGIYRERSIIGEPDHDHDLHLVLLRNVSVLGCPVSPNVLVRLPDVREYFNKVRMTPKLSRRRLVARALAVLSERGLAFRLRPHPKLIRLDQRLDTYRTRRASRSVRGLEEIDIDGVTPEIQKAFIRDFQEPFRYWPAEQEYRYALHRQMQSYCFQRLGHLTAPPVTANNFAPTLYASMPSRVVRLSQEGYLFLRRLMLGLSQYPDIRHIDAARDMPIFTNDDIVTKVQALRAAMSLARTSYSIASVSRFDHKSMGLHFTRKRGHFETYKVRLRWILRKAWEVHGQNLRRDHPRDRDHQINALYIDEIVWLYNEVAVACLAQGALTDAIGHARQAIHINQEIEGNAGVGAMHNMLSLNLAIMQLERGRLNSADRRLADLMRNESSVKKRVYNLAVGYRALIAHLQGRLTEANDGFARIIPLLEQDNELRALALMTHHKARMRARQDVAEARQLLIAARDYAESGGHEDIRYRIMVSEVWVSQTFEDNPGARARDDRVKLREVEEYAKMMGLLSLLVDTLHAQGTMLLEAGDTIGSGRLMTRAMAIARRNDMTLRLNSILTNYAKVLIARGRVLSAQRLLETALAMAKRSSYSLEVVRIHAVMGEAAKRIVSDQ